MPELIDGQLFPCPGDCLECGGLGSVFVGYEQEDLAPLMGPCPVCKGCGTKPVPNS